jgi:outer membrane phospholipase A
LVDYNKKEKSEAKRMGARAHKNSGRGKIQKGDGSWKNFIVDWKFASLSFTLNQNVWSKIVTDTLKTDKNKSPALIIVLGEGNKKTRLAVIELSELERLMENDNDD